MGEPIARSSRMRGENAPVSRGDAPVAARPGILKYPETSPIIGIGSANSAAAHEESAREY